MCEANAVWRTFSVADVLLTGVHVGWACLGECGLTFTSGATNTENWTALRSHYMDKLGRADQGHLRFIHRHGDQLTGGCFCGVCGNLFARPVDLFRHLASKTRNNTEVDSVIHAGFFEAVVLPFVGMNIENLIILSLDVSC